jgi:hypothetical protein
MRTAVSSLLFLAVFPLPNVFYEILHWIVCGVCSWLAYLAIKRDEPRWFWIMGIAAILFNPFSSIYLPPGMTPVADFAIGTSLFCLPKRITRNSRDAATGDA